MAARLNYKHLHYFWSVARAGSIAQASAQLHVTVQSISGQLGELEAALGLQLFRRAGRRLEITEAGQRILSYAEEIFALGDELLDVARDLTARRALPLRVGIADVVPKTIAYRLVEPALQLQEPVRLVCREGRLAPLLADLAVHQLDMVIADRPMPPNLKVRGYSHLLGECDVALFASAALRDSFTAPFPECLRGAPFLMPGEDSAVRAGLQAWLERRGLYPRIVGEFDDGALLKAFGEAGHGVFAAPGAIADQVMAHYKVGLIGHIPELTERFYAITTERRLSNPAIVAVREAAQGELFRMAARA